jgi:hypothetical protein
MMIGPAFTPLPSLFDQSLDFELVAPNFYFISPYNMTVEEMPHTGAHLLSRRPILPKTDFGGLHEL